MTRSLLVLLLCLATGIAGCGGDRPQASRATPEADAEPLLILAAADLQAAFAEVATRYEEQTGQTVRMVFGSTGNLTAQIENGAPADLFFAANEGFLDRLAAGGLIVEDSRRPYALGRLALVWDTAAPPPATLADLARPAYGTIAIANPEHAPYGMAAREALQAVGVWERVVPRLVQGENIAQTYQFVQTGNADAGLVALGLVMGPESRPHLLIPDSLHAPLRQAAAVIRSGANAAEARRFLDFVTGAEGREILGRYGFAVPAS